MRSGSGYVVRLFSAQNVKHVIYDRPPLVAAEGRVGERAAWAYLLSTPAERSAWVSPLDARRAISVGISSRRPPSDRRGYLLATPAENNNAGPGARVTAAVKERHGPEAAFGPQVILVASSLEVSL